MTQSLCPYYLYLECSNTPHISFGRSANPAFYIKFISNLLTKNMYYETF